MYFRNNVKFISCTFSVRNTVILIYFLEYKIVIKFEYIILYYKTEGFDIIMRHSSTINFPDAFSLDYETYYEDVKYNKIRRCKILLFSQCLGKNETLDSSQKLGDQLNTKRTFTTKLLKKLEIDESVIHIINKYLYPKIITREYIVKKLEQGCLNRSVDKCRVYNIRGVWSEPKFVDLYHNICYKLAANLDENSSINSNYIKKKIINSEIDLYQVANLSSKDICPKKYEKIDKKIDQRNNLERKIKFSELYRCSRCKRNQCTTERRYARSADEGIDLTIICLFCGHSWNS